MKLWAVSLSALLALLVQSYCLGSPCLMCAIPSGEKHSDVAALPASGASQHAVKGHHHAMSPDSETSRDPIIRLSSDMCRAGSACGTVFVATRNEQLNFRLDIAALAVIAHSVAIFGQPLISGLPQGTGPLFPQPTGSGNSVLRI